MEEIEAKAQRRQEAAIKRERAMAYAFSNQVKKQKHCVIFLNLFLKNIVCNHFVDNIGGVFADGKNQQKKVFSFAVESECKARWKVIALL